MWSESLLHLPKWSRYKIKVIEMKWKKTGTNTQVADLSDGRIVVSKLKRVHAKAADVRSGFVGQWRVVWIKQNSKKIVIGHWSELSSAKEGAGLWYAQKIPK